MLLLLNLIFSVTWAAKTGYCAGGFVAPDIWNRELTVWSGSSSNTLYFGGISGFRQVDPITWDTQAVWQFSSDAKFQLVDDQRRYAWLQTSTGLASIDLDQNNAQPVYSDINYQNDKSTCAGDIAVLDQLRGFSYVLCRNSSSASVLVQLDLTNEKVSVVNTVFLNNFQIGQKYSIIALSKDRSRSFLFVASYDSLDQPMNLYIISTNSSFRIQNIFNFTQTNTLKVLGGDQQNVYTVEGDAATGSRYIARREISTGKVTLKSSKLTSGQIIDSMFDSTTDTLLLWTTAGISRYSIKNLKGVDSCQRIPTTKNCTSWLPISSTLTVDAYWSARCQDTLTTMVFRIALSDRTSCKVGCGEHGQCINSNCLCFDDYTGKDCSGAPHGCGMVCTKDSDCWNDPPWNPCPVCYSRDGRSPKTCRSVCTAPCTATSQCEAWAKHSVLNQVCKTCNLEFQYCCAGC